jgi:hypothetical protein
MTSLEAIRCTLSHIPVLVVREDIRKTAAALLLPGDMTTDVNASGKRNQSTNQGK